MTPHHAPPMTRGTRPTGEALDSSHLATTSLEHLNAAAGLLTRIDRKYLVPLPAAQSVVDELSATAEVLEIDGRRRFSYTSTYFDTPELLSYAQSAHARRRRFKVRTRTYVDSGLSYLEVKTRGARGITVKRRTPYGADDVALLAPEARSFVAACLTQSGTCPADAADALVERLAPVVGTSYQRTTLLLPEDGTRVTIDSALTWYALTPEGGVERRRERRQAEGLAVVESKTCGGASPADRVLWARGHRPTRISKYATGLALLNPDLAANRWHRVLGRELAAAARSREGAAHSPADSPAASRQDTPGSSRAA